MGNGNKILIGNYSLEDIGKRMGDFVEFNKYHNSEDHILYMGREHFILVKEKLSKGYKEV